MTEYRNVEDIREVLFRYARNKHSKAFSKFLTSEIERKNKPDVVERSKIDKTISQLEEEKEFACADFEEYNEEVLGYDDTDICERDLCHIGLARAIEILKRNLGDD